jgi:hypothetical protein
VLDRPATAALHDGTDRSTAHHIVKLVAMAAGRQEGTRGADAAEAARRTARPDEVRGLFEAGGRGLRVAPSHLTQCEIRQDDDAADGWGAQGARQCC